MLSQEWICSSQPYAVLIVSALQVSGTPWGKAGNGAPIRTKSGKLFTKTQGTVLNAMTGVTEMKQEPSYLERQAALRAYAGAALASRQHQARAIYPRTHQHTHTHMHTCTHAYTHMHTHMHTHTHTHSLSHTHLLSSVIDDAESRCFLLLLLLILALPRVNGGPPPHS